METLKLVVVLGVLGSAVAVGLAYLLAAVTGGSVTADEIVRHALRRFGVSDREIAAIVERRP